MTQLVQMWRSCMYLTSYSSLSKKDEDLGVEQTQSWVNKCPINGAEVKKWEFAKVQNYVQNPLKELKPFPIAFVNKALVERHLVVACKSNPTMRAIIKTDVKMRGSQIEIK